MIDNMNRSLISLTNTTYHNILENQTIFLYNIFDFYNILVLIDVFDYFFSDELRLIEIPY